MTKIVFVSNYMSHHQKPFCDAMRNLCGQNFYFVATKVMDQERIQMGWKADDEDYIVPTYLNNEYQKKAKQLTYDADIVILGSASDEYIVSRLKAGKLTFKYAERFYKKGLTIRSFPHAIVGAWLHHGRFQQYPLYMLCASAYTAVDCALFHNYVGRTYKWGYFTEVKSYDVDKLMEKKLSVTSSELKNLCVSILWAGRLIKWKHPDVSIQLAASLKKKGYSFKMSIIGNGEMEVQLCSMIKEKELDDYVEMLGAISPDEVRTHMEKADIYLFTSDFNEGWGAVLNESMNSGCAVVANHAIGSVPFLIENGKNGLIYENGNIKDLLKQVEKLLNDSNYRIMLGKNAYYTMKTTWNSEIAAKRFLELAEGIRTKKDVSILFSDGPCSRAEVIDNDWYKSEEY